jgi:phosphatidylserine decarboxylase
VNRASRHRAIGDRIAAGLARRAPGLRLYSHAVGWLSRRRLPRPVRAPLYGALGRSFGARLEEAELPLADYPSLGALFSRRLRPGARPLPADPDAVISPCDGTLSAMGAVRSGQLVQAKGRRYPLAQFVGDQTLAAALAGGTYFTVYLSPRDYHRVHAPVRGRLAGYQYIPGRLLPVGAGFRRRVDRLYAANERMVLRLDTERGPVAVALVGAAGVGNLSVPAAGLESRHLRRARRPHRMRFDVGLEVDRGAELGAFHLGSTVVVMLPPGFADVADGEPERAVRVGEPVARMISAGGRVSGGGVAAGGKA